MNLLNHESKMNLFKEKMSSGPKWSSGLQDIVKRNQQSSNPAFQAASSQSSYQQESSSNRLKMKLMNIHQSVDQPTVLPPNLNINTATSATAGLGAGGSISALDAKRFALDDCTNFLQQKTLQQNYPSTAQALSNIINSNRSASSTAIHHSNTGIPSGKTFPSFKFNLTLNKHRHQPNQMINEYSNNFYPSTQHDNLLANQELLGYEDNEALLMQDHQQQLRNFSQNNRQQTLKSVVSNTGGAAPEKLLQPKFQKRVFEQRDVTEEDSQAFEEMDEREQHEMFMQHQESHKMAALKKSNQKPRQKSMTKERGQIHKMEERQQIFEEEIIKRVKEIQNYAKQLHLSIKKIQSVQSKRQDEWNQIKDQLIGIKDSFAKDDNQLSEQQVNEIVERKLHFFEGEIQLQMSNSETQITKDFESKLKLSLKSTNNDFQQKLDRLREDLQSQLQDELMPLAKQEILRTASEKSKSAILELKQQLDEQTLYIEDLVSKQNNFQKDWNSKHDKLNKAMREEKEQSDETIASINKEFEMFKRKIMKDIKNEIDMSQYATQTDLSDQVTQINAKMSQLNHLSKSQDDQSLQDQLINQRLEDVEDKISQQINSLQTKVNQQNSKFTDLQDKIQSSDKQFEGLQTKYNQQVQKLSSSIKQLEEKASNEARNIQQELEDQIRDIERRLKAEIKDIENRFSATASQKHNDINEDQIVSKSMEHIEPKLEQFRNQTQTFNDQLESIKQQLSQKLQRSELQEVKTQIDDQLDKVNKDKKKINEKVVQIQEIVNSQNEKIESNEQALEDLKYELSTFSSQAEESKEEQKENRQYTNQIYEELSNDIIHIKEKYDQLMSSNTQFNQKLQQHDNQIVSFQNQHVQFENEIRDLTEQLQESQNEQSNLISQLQSKIEDWQISAQTSNPSPQDSEKIFSEVNEKLDLVSEEIKSLMQQMSDLQLRTASVEEDQEALKYSEDERFNQLQSLMDDKFKDIDAINEKISELDHKQNYYEKIKDLNAFVEIKLSENQEQTESKIESIEQKIKKIQEFEQSKVQSAESVTIQELEERIQNFDDQIQESLASIQRQLDDHDNLLKDINFNEKSKQNQEIINTGVSIEDVRNEITKLDQKYQSLQQKLQKDSKESFLQIDEKLENLQLELQQINPLRDELIKHDDNFDNFRQQLQNMEQKLKELEKLQVLQDEIKQIQFLYDLQLSSLQQDAKSTKELINCIQDVTVNQEDFLQLKTLVEQEINQLNSLLNENREHIQKIYDELSTIRGAFVHNEKLENETQNLQDQVNAAFQYLQSKLQHVLSRTIPRIEIQKISQYQEQQNVQLLPLGLEVSNIHSNRSPQLFGPGSARQAEDNNNYQAHFLEELSEVDISSYNKQNANQTSDGDIMMFNNKTQSLGASSIMSNKLVNMISPTEQRQILFNQQVVYKLGQQQNEGQEQESIQDHHEQILGHSPGQDDGQSERKSESGVDSQVNNENLFDHMIGDNHFARQSFEKSQASPDAYQIQHLIQKSPQENYSELKQQESQIQQSSPDYQQNQSSQGRNSFLNQKQYQDEEEEKYDDYGDSRAHDGEVEEEERVQAEFEEQEEYFEQVEDLLIMDEVQKKVDLGLNQSKDKALAPQSQSRYISNKEETYEDDFQNDDQQIEDVEQHQPYDLDNFSAYPQLQNKPIVQQAKNDNVWNFENADDDWGNDEEDYEQQEQHKQELIDFDPQQQEHDEQAELLRQSQESDDRSIKIGQGNQEQEQMHAINLLQDNLLEHNQQVSNQEEKEIEQEDEEEEYEDDAFEELQEEIDDQEFEEHQEVEYEQEEEIDPEFMDNEELSEVLTDQVINEEIDRCIIEIYNFKRGRTAQKQQVQYQFY